MVFFKQIKAVLIVIICLSTFSVAFYLVRNLKGKEISIKVNDISINCDLKLQKVHLIERKKDKKEWELEANSTEFFDSEKTTHLERVKLKFYPENQKEITIIGDKGKFNNETKNMEISGNVVVSSLDGYSLKTDSLKWIASKKVVETEDPVEISSESLLVTGKGLFSESDQHKMEIKSNVTAIIYDLKSGLSRP